MIGLSEHFGNENFSPLSVLLPYTPCNKLERRFSMRFLLIEVALPILSLIASLLFFSAHALATVGLAFLVTAAIMVYFVRFNLAGKA